MTLDPQMRLLIVDDEPLFRESLGEDLARDGASVVTVGTVADACAAIQRAPFDIILLDQRLPDGDGLAIVPVALDANDAVKVLLMTAFPSYDHAVQALRVGVHDYLSKPVDVAEVRHAVNQLYHTAKLERIAEVHRLTVSHDEATALFIGQSGRAQAIQGLIRRAQGTMANVLITGETGSGKTLVAKAIHYGSPLSQRPFISVNCAALPETLVEAELFGVEKGAYTGAVPRRGLLELAEGGTLFLDEIAEMPVAMQAKLLAVIEERKVRRLGGEQDRFVNVRFLAATNLLLQDALANGKFRRDLFYRLNVLTIDLPPLRERRDDIPRLCEHFIRELAPGRRVQVAAADLPALMQYDFPGNVRELRNILERALILEDGPWLHPSRLLEASAAAAPAAEPIRDATATHLNPLETVMREHILAAYTQCGENLTRTAQALGLSLSTLRRKLVAYGRLSRNASLGAPGGD
ncbi:MAG: sigma-54 dependent transcriptional regulator [Chloracidobacterium sp.]|uniref:Sigma-54-dependent Fis family transcriptional regulator n=1 Tax=Chloracidobacterium validum TaxID=2821543 RepID=A0ABX8B7H6_9BACT|nr:sigma-54 dependent transcriptional regulator [Chloracidobacterium validum]QUW02903.1 sigma-54-dependent Fis family transcriptional regulator [Chloracidobacterium validum]